MAVGRERGDLLVAGSLSGPEYKLVAPVFAFDYPGLTGAVGELASHWLGSSWLRGARLVPPNSRSEAVAFVQTRMTLYR